MFYWVLLNTHRHKHIFANHILKWIECLHFQSLQQSPLVFIYTLHRWSTICLTKGRDPQAKRNLLVSGRILVGEWQCFLKGIVQPEIKYFVIIFIFAWCSFEVGSKNHQPHFLCGQKLCQALSWFSNSCGFSNPQIFQSINRFTYSRVFFTCRL